MKLKLLNRLPDKKEIYPVYGLLVLLIYGWSLYHFVWHLPSWIKFLTAEEIGVILCYTLATDFVESLLFLIGLLSISFILPADWFRDDFVARSGLITLSILILFMFVSYTPLSYKEFLTLYVLLGGFIYFNLIYLILKKTSLLWKLISLLADHSIIFLYISIPASVIAILVVFVRNI